MKMESISPMGKITAFVRTAWLPISRQIRFAGAAMRC